MDIPGEKCLVTFKDGDTIWALFKDLKPSTIDINESPVKCIVCKSTQSKKNNVVVACETCLRGYHQKCHQVHIILILIIYGLNYLFMLKGLLYFS